MRRAIFLTCMILLLAAGPLPGQAQDDGLPVAYVVQPDDNLSRIALQYGVSTDTLQAANDLAGRYAVFAGQVLSIPADQAEDAPGTRTHVVGHDETLAAIAWQYGVPVEALIATNHIVHPGLLRTGQVLVLPGTALATAIPVPTSTPAATDVALESPDPYFASQDLGLLGPGVSPVAAMPTPTGTPAATGVAVALESSDPYFAPQDLGIIAEEIPPPPVWMSGVIQSGGPQMSAVFQRGLALGNNPRAFSKIGDCNSEEVYFLSRFDRGDYDLGPYVFLQPVIEHFAGSFARDSVSVWTGNHTWALFNPIWANPVVCLPGETPLACEFRVHRPSFVLIRLGTNDVGAPGLFEENLRKIIEFSIESGVIPVLGTKADQLEGSDAFNGIIRRLAQEYDVPLWDFGQRASTLPARGLMPDGIHLSYSDPYYSAAGTLQTGHALQNLMALMALDAVWHDVMN